MKDEKKYGKKMKEVFNMTTEQKKEKVNFKNWIWKCRLIDSDISWEQYKDKYWQCTWKPKLTDKPGHIRL